MALPAESFRDSKSILSIMEVFFVFPLLDVTGYLFLSPALLFPLFGCARGIEPASDCPALRGASAEAKAPTTRPESDLPWSGAALGGADLSVITAFGRPRIVGLVGLENAGKTTILATLYLWRCEIVGYEGCPGIWVRGPPHGTARIRR